MSDLSEKMASDALEGQRLARKHFVVELDYSPDSLARIDAIADDVEFILTGGVESNLDLLTRVWGAYLGETLRRHKGAAWIEDETGPAMRLGDVALLRPHEQVRRRIANGDEHGLAKFFENAG